MKGSRYRAAAALDATHAHDARGPRTFLTRQRVATALDTGKNPVPKDVRWLESVAKREKDS